ncbi:hypothetical protein B0O80DRAFT_11638 [Mortierella sp. GBAus27b]|nr:hypothetical protein B0O80DRAFT_11638 [Mortierella sp. GBAus27b]
MSSSSTKQRGRCSNPLLHTPTFMTGAEMFVLQQSAKHYLLIEQTRMLSPHEQQEFEKVKELLRPSLLRYTQRLTTQSAHESSAQNSHSSSSKPQGGRTKPTAQHEVRAATLPTQSKTKSAAMGSSERTVMTTNKPLGTSKINSTLTGTQSNTDTRGSAKKGSKKRPKMDIYQDSENAPTKRSRQRRQTDLDDPDKENRDPLDPFSCRPKQNVLGDATNRSNNTTMGSDIKGKNVIRNSSSNKTDTQTTTPVSSKPKADARERSSVDQTSTITTTKRQPKRAKLDSTRELPSTMGTKSSLGVDAPSSKVVGGSKEPRVAPSPVLALTGGSTRHVQGKPTVAKQRSGAKELPKEQKPAIQEHMYTAETRSVDAKPTTVIPASVEEDSGSSFALTLDVHQSVPPMPSKHKAKYEVVQDSEESEDQDSISGSQEKTFPMPEFLLSDVPEDPLEEPTFPAPEFLLDDDPQDPLEEPTFPAPEFLLDDDPQDPPEDLTHPTGQDINASYPDCLRSRRCFCCGTRSSFLCKGDVEGSAS